MLSTDGSVHESHSIAHGAEYVTKCAKVYSIAVGALSNAQVLLTICMDNRKNSKFRYDTGCSK